MNLASFCRKHNVSRATGTRWKKRGWIVLFTDGSVDVAASDEKLAQLRDRNDPRATRGKLALPDAIEEDGSADAEAPGWSLDEARRRKEIALAVNAEIDLALRQGRMLDAEEIERRDASRCLGLQNRLLAIPSEQALRLYGCKSPAELSDVLRKAIKGALIEFLDAYGIA